MIISGELELKHTKGDEKGENHKKNSIFKLQNIFILATLLKFSKTE